MSVGVSIFATTPTTFFYDTTTDELASAFDTLSDSLWAEEDPRGLYQETTLSTDGVSISGLPWEAATQTPPLHHAIPGTLGFSPPQAPQPISQRYLDIETTHLEQHLFGAHMLLGTAASFLKKMFDQVLDLAVEMIGRAYTPGYQRVSDFMEDLTIKYLVNQSRDFDEYVTHCGTIFERAAMGLGPNERWLDGGAGHAKPMKKLSRLKGIDAPHMVGVGLTQALGLKEYPIDYLSGRRIQDIHPSEIGETDLITDLQGAATYGAPDEVLAKYLEVARPGSTIILSIPLIENSSINIDGAPMDAIRYVNHFVNGNDFCEWLQMIEGIELVEIGTRTIQYAFGPLKSVVMQHVVLRPTGAPICIPCLKHVNIAVDTPPQRVFEIDITSNLKPVFAFG